MENKKILPPTYFNICLVTIIGIHFFLPVLKLVYFPWNLIGIIPLFSGVILNIVADRIFKRLSTTVKPFEVSTTLVTESVFSVSRHPMYLGMVLILLGIAILLGSLSPFFIVAVFAGIMEILFIKIEEQMLEEKFGSNYIEYRKKVRKWI